MCLCWTLGKGSLGKRRFWATFGIEAFRLRGRLPSTKERGSIQQCHDDQLSRSLVEQIHRNLKCQHKLVVTDTFCSTSLKTRVFATLPVPYYVFIIWIYYILESSRIQTSDKGDHISQEYVSISNLENSPSTLQSQTRLTSYNMMHESLSHHCHHDSKTHSFPCFPWLPCYNSGSPQVNQPQEKPREILEQIAGLPGLRSIVDNFDISVVAWVKVAVRFGVEPPETMG